MERKKSASEGDLQAETSAKRKTTNTERLMLGSIHLLKQFQKKKSFANCIECLTEVT